MKAIADIGPFNGLRVYAENDTTNPIIWIEMTARREIMGLARDALDHDTITFLKDGVQYELPAGVPLARQLINAFWERG